LSFSIRAHGLDQAFRIRDHARERYCLFVRIAADIVYLGELTLDIKNEKGCAYFSFASVVAL
jgi:hypothetical protein